MTIDVPCIKTLHDSKRRLDTFPAEVSELCNRALRLGGIVHTTPTEVSVHFNSDTKATRSLFKKIHHTLGWGMFHVRTLTWGMKSSVTPSFDPHCTAIKPMVHVALTGAGWDFLEIWNEDGAQVGPDDGDLYWFARQAMCEVDHVMDHGGLNYNEGDMIIADVGDHDLAVGIVVNTLLRAGYAVDVLDQREGSDSGDFFDEEELEEIERLMDKDD